MASDSNPVSTHFEHSARVYLRGDSGVVRSCEKHVENEILKGLIAKSAEPIPILRHDGSRTRSGTISASSSLLTCDFLSMTLTDGETGFKEAIIIDLPWSPNALRFIVFQGTDRTLKHTVLAMALQRTQSQPVLKNLLAAKGVPYGQIWENPHLRPGHQPFDKFLNSLVDFFEAEKNPEASRLFETFLAMADAGADQIAPNDSLKQLQRGGIQLGFHGTNHAVMDRILETGLDPQLRQVRHANFFGATFNVSLEYSMKKTNRSGEPRNLLFFMIIAPERVGAYEVADNKFQLPFAKVALTVAY